MLLLVIVFVSLAGSSSGCSQREEMTEHKTNLRYDFELDRDHNDNSSDPLGGGSLINWEQAIIAFPVNISGHQDYPEVESQKPLLIYAADNYTRMAAGGACPPGRFIFGRSFEDMEYQDSNARRMANYRAAYTQDGFFICGLTGGYGLKHECCHWSMHTGGENECMLLDEGHLPEFYQHNELIGLDMIVATDETRYAYQDRFYYYLSNPRKTVVIRGQLNENGDGFMRWKEIPGPHFAPYTMNNTSDWKYTDACPVVIEDKLLLIGGGSGGMTSDHSLIYDHEKGHWYKTHPLFPDSTNFVTLSCIVDKRLPRVIVLGKTMDEIKLVVLKVGNYQNSLHLQPMAPVTIGDGLRDGIMFALDPPTDESKEERYEVVLVGQCDAVTGNYKPCIFEMERCLRADCQVKGEITKLQRGGSIFPLNKYTNEVNFDSMEFSKNRTRFAMVKATYFDRDCEPLKVIPKAYGAPDY